MTGGRVNRLCRRRDASPSPAFKDIRENKVILLGATTLLQDYSVFQGRKTLKKRFIGDLKDIYKAAWWQSSSTPPSASTKSWDHFLL